MLTGFQWNQWSTILPTSNQPNFTGENEVSPISYHNLNGVSNDLSILHVPQDTPQCWALQIRCLREPLGKSARDILLDMEGPHLSHEKYPGELIAKKGI